MHFEPGDVLRLAWDDRPIRVLLADEIEIMYEALDLSLARARTAHYYRTSAPGLESNAELLEKAPLTAQERAKHRPDLPMRVLRSTEADWSKSLPDWPEIDCRFRLTVPRLAIMPFGPRGAVLTGITVEAANGSFFTGDELLKTAHSLQHAHNPEVEGVGLYRLGLSGGVPSYYIWGSVDQAGHAA